jgi:hypothetical protein
VQRLAQQAAGHSRRQMLIQQRPDLRKHRAAVPSAKPRPPLGLEIGASLRRIELADQPDELRRRLVRPPYFFRNHVLGFDKVPPGMYPAAKVHEPVRIGDRVIRLVSVGHEHGATANAGPQVTPVLFAAPRRITEQSHRRPAAGHLNPHKTFRLWGSSGFLEHLYGRLVREHDFAIEQMIAHQVDDRLYRNACAHHARRQRIARDVAAEALEQRGDPIQWQAVHELGDDEPRERRFAKQPFRDDARAGRRHLQALVAARAGVLHALVPNHPHLLRDDVELFAHLDADFDQHRAVVGANALRFGQLIANDFAWQGRIERLATALLACVTGHLRFGFVFLLRRQGCRRRRQRLSLVQEQVALIGAACFALRAKQPALKRLQLLLEQIAFDLRHA